PQRRPWLLGFCGGGPLSHAEWRFLEAGVSGRRKRQQVGVPVVWRRDRRSLPAGPDGRCLGGRRAPSGEDQEAGGGWEIELERAVFIEYAGGDTGPCWICARRRKRRDQSMAVFRLGDVQGAGNRRLSKVEERQQIPKRICRVVPRAGGRIDAGARRPTVDRGFKPTSGCRIFA